MGHTVILIGASALVSALLCLFLGYRWGRSNVKSQIENALDMARVSSDAREFAIREQLDERMVELSRLRELADKVPLLLEQIEKMQSSRSRLPSSGMGTGVEPQEAAFQKPQQQGISISASGEPTIPRPLNSKEERIKQSDPTPDVDLEKGTRLPVTKFPVKFPTSFTPQVAAPEPPKPPVTPPVAAKPPAVKPLPARPPAPQPVAAKPVAKPVPKVNNDDWDEFAKSLEALKKLQ